MAWLSCGAPPINTNTSANERKPVPTTTQESRERTVRDMRIDGELQRVARAVADEAVISYDPWNKMRQLSFTG